MTKISGTPEQLQHRRDLVTALRSGKYQQGRARLREGDGMCCLGVGADLSGLGKWVTRGGMWVYLIDGQEFKTSLMAIDSAAKSPLTEYFGFNGAGVFTGPAIEHTSTRAGHVVHSLCLAELNDRGMPFSEIADIIELKWEVAP